MAKTVSISAVTRIGKSLVAKQRKTKPAFTVQEFLKGTQLFKERVAEDFIQYVNDFYSKTPPDLKLLEKVVSKGVTHQAMLKGVRSKDGIVFVSGDKEVANYSYKELWSMLEFGRKDKKIMPQPILKKCFSSYAPRYRKMVKKFLRGE